MMLEVRQRTPDLFGFFDLDEDRRLPCSSLAVFIDYLLSSSAALARADSISIPLGYAALHVQGPVTDDGGRLSVRYKATREEAAALPEEKQKVLWRRLEELSMPEVEVKKVCAALKITRR